MPLTLGNEGAGVVEAVGAGVTHLQGRATAPPTAAARRAATASARVMPAKTRRASCPTRSTFETGAAMMLKGLTAQYLLQAHAPQGGCEPGDYDRCSTRPPAASA